MCVYFPVFFLYKWWLNFSYLWSSSFHFSRFSLTFDFNQVQWQEFQEFSFLRFLRSSDSVFSLSSRNQVSGANEQMQLKSVPSGKFGKTEPENNRKMSQRLRERQQIRFRFVDQFSFQYQFCDFFFWNSVNPLDL